MANNTFISGAGAFDHTQWTPIDMQAQIIGFQTNYNYQAGEVIAWNNQIYAAKDDFVSLGVWDPADWIPLISESQIRTFQPNHYYPANTLIYYDGILYRNPTAFTSTSTFVPTNWQRIITNLSADDVAYTNSILGDQIVNLRQTLDNLIPRIKAIEDAIYNWANDKTTKIPRGTINITSGGPNSNWIIQSRDKNQNNDLNFE